MNETPILIVPGRGNSEPEHWQSLLESSLPATQRVQQEWHVNDIEIWSENIDRAVAQLDRPPLVVAHSFGCLATAYAQIVLGTPIGATLFVAPADPARFGLDRRLFAHALARPGFLVASASDPWLSLDKAIGLARDWEVDYINLGDVGHINVASGHGRWRYGEALATTMRSDLDAIHSSSLSAPPRRPDRPGCHARTR